MRTVFLGSCVGVVVRSEPQGEWKEVDVEFIDPNCDDRVRLMRCQRDTVYLLSCDLGPRRWMDGWICACSSAGLDLHLLSRCQVDDGQGRCIGGWLN